MKKNKINCTNCVYYKVCYDVITTKKRLKRFLQKYPYNILLSKKNKDKYNTILNTLLETTVCIYYIPKEEK